MSSLEVGELIVGEGSMDDGGSSHRAGWAYPVEVGHAASGAMAFRTYEEE